MGSGNSDQSEIGDARSGAPDQGGGREGTGRAGRVWQASAESVENKARFAAVFPVCRTGKSACRPGKLANPGPKYRRRSEPGAAEPPSGRSDSVPPAGRPVITGPKNVASNPTFSGRVAGLGMFLLFSTLPALAAACQTLPAPSFVLLWCALWWWWIQCIIAEVYGGLAL